MSGMGVTRLGSMPGIRAISSALAAGACAAALAACGGDDEGGPIPQEEGNQLIGQLDDIESLVEQGACDAAQQVAVEFATGVNNLPEEVGGELRQRLVEASGNLESLTGDQCTPPTGTTGETGELPPETTEEVPLPEEETTEEPTTTDEEEPPPPEEDEGNGPPTDTPGGGDPGGGNQGGGSIGGDEDSSGGIGSGG
jgi:hypothetical protein